METRQLVLIDNDGADPDNAGQESKEWRLDERTRQVGWEGIAEARRALREALSRGHDQSSAA